jgi:hypothetical protein
VSDDLIRLMGEDLAGGSVPDTARDAMHTIVGIVGTIAGAARILGVPRSTFRGWLTGRQPRLPRQALQAAVRGVLIAVRGRTDHYNAAYAGRIRLRIAGTVIVSSDSRPRTLRVGEHIPMITMRNIIRAWASGDDDAASRLLRRAIARHYQRNLDIVAETGAWFQ